MDEIVTISSDNISPLQEFIWQLNEYWLSGVKIHGLPFKEKES